MRATLNTSGWKILCLSRTEPLICSQFKHDSPLRGGTYIWTHITRLIQVQIFCKQSPWQPHFTLFRRSGNTISLVIPMSIIHLFVILHPHSKKSKLISSFYSVNCKFTRRIWRWAALKLYQVSQVLLQVSHKFCYNIYELVVHSVLFLFLLTRRTKRSFSPISKNISFSHSDE